VNCIKLVNAFHLHLIYTVSQQLSSYKLLKQKKLIDNLTRVAQVDYGPRAYNITEDASTDF